MSETLNKQLLHLVFGGELENLEDARFRDPDELDIVGIFPTYEAGRKSVARQGTGHRRQCAYALFHCPPAQISRPLMATASSAR